MPNSPHKITGRIAGRPPPVIYRRIIWQHAAGDDYNDAGGGANPDNSITSILASGDDCTDCIAQPPRNASNALL